MLPMVIDSLCPTHSVSGVHALNYKLLGLFTLNYKAFSYSTTQRHDLHFNSINSLDSTFFNLFSTLRASLYLYNQTNITLQNQGQETLWLYYGFALRANKSWSLYNGLNQNLCFKPQNMPWGDSIPNRPLTQTSWLALDSFYQCGDLCMETLQLCLNSCKVDSTLSDCLLNILYMLSRDCGIRTTFLDLFLCPLHLFIVSCLLPATWSMKNMLLSASQIAGPLVYGLNRLPFTLPGKGSPFSFTSCTASPWVIPLVI